MDAADLVIAAPREYEEVLRSGTWATVRYTRHSFKRLIIVRPDGTIREHNP